MDRTTAPNSVSGAYVDDDPETGTTGTLLIATDRNAVQEEIVGVIEGAGITPNVADNGQLLEALRKGDGSSVDSDKLDGQHGSYYTNASNLSSGTVPAGRLPSIDAATLNGQAGSYYTNASNLSSGTIAEARLPANTVNNQGLNTTDTPSFLGGVKVPDSRISFPLPYHILTPAEYSLAVGASGKPLVSASYAQVFAVSRTHVGVWGGDANILGIYEYLSATPVEIVLSDFGGASNNQAFCAIRLYSVGATATVTGWIANYANGTLRTRTFNGSALGTVGNVLTGIDDTQYANITRIGKDQVGAVISHGNGNLQAYSFDGTDWTAIGDPYTLTGAQATFKVRYLKESTTEQYYLCTYVSTTRKFAVVARNKSTNAWRTVFEEDAAINTTSDVGIAVHNQNLFVWISDASPYRTYWFKVTDSGVTLLENLGARAATTGTWIRPELDFLGDSLMSADPGPKVLYGQDFDFFVHRARHTEDY